jgi:hypothetical protein
MNVKVRFIFAGHINSPCKQFYATLRCPALQKKKKLDNSSRLDVAEIARVA